MATTYLKLAGVNGPANPGGTVQVPSNQPAGFGVADSFEIESVTTGVDRTGAPFLGQSDGTVSVAPSPMRLFLRDSPATNPLWMRLHDGQAIATACLVQTRPDKETRWVSSYWLLSEVVVMSAMSQYADGDDRPYLSISLASRSVRLRQFAEAAGGGPGAAVPDFTWDYEDSAPG